MKGLELIDSAGPLRAARIDGVAHLDLRIDATVEAVMSDRLRNEQQRDGEQAQAADGSQHWVGMARTISLVVRVWLLWSVMTWHLAWSF